MATATNDNNRPSVDDASLFANLEARDEVFAKLRRCEDRAASPQPKPIVIQRTPIAPRPTQVTFRPRRRGRIPADDNDFDLSRFVMQTACVGLMLLSTVLFYRGMPSTWRATINPLANSASTLASAAPASDTARDEGLQTKRIQDVRVGDRLAGRNPIREQVEGVEPDPATWRAIGLYMTKESGLGLWIELLRPLTWIEEHNAKPGSTISIDLYEMGALGDAQVTYLSPCPEIQPGNGTVVTGTFKHQADINTKVMNLKLEDQIEVTGVTDNYPYWSEDRQDFVEVGNLRTGELVDTAYGRKHVVSVRPIEHSGFLYNLETTEHVYRVGSLGTLVHNFCVHRITPDAHGRVRSAIAHITIADLTTGTATNSATRLAARAIGNATDDAGHLIGRLLGGPGGRRSGNFFAQNPHINRGQFAQLEQRVAGFVRNGDDVWIRVTPQYAGNGTRATNVFYQVRVNGQTMISELFRN